MTELTRTLRASSHGSAHGPATDPLAQARVRAVRRARDRELQGVGAAERAPQHRRRSGVALSAEPQFALTELLLCDEVDRIIVKRLRLPSYDTWREAPDQADRRAASPRALGTSPGRRARARAAAVVGGARARCRRARRSVGALSRRERLRRHDAHARGRRARARDAGGDRRGARRAGARADRRPVVVDAGRASSPRSS